MAKRQPKFQNVETNLADAISEAFSNMNDLSSECRDVCDNMPDSLQGGARYEALDNSASELEKDEPDFPDALQELKVTVVRPTKMRQQSRRARAEEAEGILRNSIDVIQEWIDNAPNTGVDTTDAREEAAQELRDACEELADAIGNCEFPGMYG
jgi:ABC-type transporter Mla subunit MlaD